jgi:hypothetical protein
MIFKYERHALVHDKEVEFKLWLLHLAYHLHLR